MVVKAEQKILTPAEVRGAVRALRRKLETERLPVREVSIFGSYARGKAHRDSDVDVAIVFSSMLSSRAQKKIRHIPWWAKQIHVKLEPHILSARDLLNPWLSLPSEVRKHGIRVK